MEYRSWKLSSWRPKGFHKSNFGAGGTSCTGFCNLERYRGDMVVKGSYVGKKC